MFICVGAGSCFWGNFPRFGGSDLVVCGCGFCCERGENERERQRESTTTRYHPEVWGIYIEVGATLTML